MTEISLFSAFVMGLVGSGHCLVMCGGIASSLQLAQTKQSPFVTALLYNLGRLGSYMVAGALVAGLGAAFAKQSTLFANILNVLSGVFMLLVGVYVMRLAATLNWLEKAGKWLLWQRLVQLNKYLLPVDSKTKALAYGALWGWLPCGLVYSALTWTLQADGSFSGALTMAAFALGTFPAMLAVGQTAQLLNTFLNHKATRIALGNIFIWYGFYLLIIATDKLVH
ncbi:MULTISPECIES: sulfite exporter TauE/SafE family protein [unclassified Pseudoalteromonas]|uniref:sulfite exporter TauE/SafE family protein n=1 Tax=unclassified Pseudoalteromonas TaxID=194690 RepID=UPI002096CFC9|nr:sulfite exporter TauE/SafE family protein [Pseudoalteromonas sp. XMcav2-N]MCO7187287.1 sulfite exporter TauE/SafE family protein [Pseudoalteromonas sp. XMcav2-N]